jgi:hypothetical protein
MSNVVELQNAYEAIMLLSLRGEITREERNARIVALRDAPAAAGMSREQREAIANKAVARAAEIFDEVHFSPSGGRWQ